MNVQRKRGLWHTMNTEHRPQWPATMIDTNQNQNQSPGLTIDIGKPAFPLHRHKGIALRSFLPF